MGDPRRERLERRFALLDRDRDGTVGAADYALLGERLTAAAGLPADDAVGAALRGALAVLWDRIAARAGAGDDGTVTRAQWMASVTNGDGPDPGVDRALAEVVRTTLVAFDPDGLGHWDKVGFDRFAQAHGMSEPDTEGAFEHLDPDGTGTLSYDVLQRSAREFYGSDEDAPGTWLFGPPR